MIRKPTREKKVNFKICKVTNWIKNKYSSILPDISRSKGNQTIKFAQLSCAKIMLKNHAQNVVKKLVPDPFLKNRN